MGVEILLQRQMTRIHREAPLGRVTGITAIEVDDSYRQKTLTVNIRGRGRHGVKVSRNGDDQTKVAVLKLTASLLTNARFGSQGE
jgi:hypothetical protein